MLPEVWRSIPSLPEYEASSYGRVMRAPYKSQMPNGGERIYSVSPTFGQAHPKNGMRPIIVVNKHTYKVAKLVCETFHGPRPFPKAVVMHDDDDQTNNCQENLIWGTQKQNLNTPKFIAYCKSRIGYKSPASKARRRKIMDALRTALADRKGN